MMPKFLHVLQLALYVPFFFLQLSSAVLTVNQKMNIIKLYLTDRKLSRLNRAFLNLDISQGLSAYREKKRVYLGQQQNLKSNMHNIYATLIQSGTSQNSIKYGLQCCFFKEQELHLHKEKSLRLALFTSQH